MASIIRFVSSPLLSILAGLAIQASFAQAALQEVAHHVDIAAQPLATALIEFSKQMDIVVVAPANLIEGKSAPGVSGDLRPSEALERLLSGTRLRYSRGTEGEITIIPADAALRSESETSLRVAQAEETENTALPSPDAASSREPVTLEEIIVTGTRIRGVVPESSPVTVYHREDILQSGASTLDQFARTMPQNFASVDQIQATSAAGASGSSYNFVVNTTRGASFNLRGLGAAATLTLINGHRVSPAGQDGNFVDISLIPVAAIERVEVLSDGASAIYGADAIGGVVNIVLRNDFKGAETNLQYGGATQGGAEEWTASQLGGLAWGSGNAAVGYSFRDEDGLDASERSFIPPGTGLSAGPNAIVASGKTESGYLSGRQEFLGLTLRGDANYSDRDFSQINGLISAQDGKSVQRGAALTLERKFATNWSASIGAIYSAIEQNIVEANFLFPLTVHYQYDTKYRSATALVEGPLFTLPGGALRVALGAETHRDDYSQHFSFDFLFPIPDSGTPFDRKADSAFVEVFAPLIGEANTAGWAQRLELSIATRYDEYNDFGSSTNPRFGLLWAPTHDLRFRATYGTSFKPPAINDLHSVPVNIATHVPNPADPDPLGTPVILLQGGNPGLGPEESHSISFGFDYTPSALPGLSLSASYFSTDFSERIGQFPVVGGSSAAFFDPVAIDAIVNQSPTAGEIGDIFTGPGFINNDGLTQGEIIAIIDGRNQNLSDVKTSGFDLRASYHWSTPAGDFSVDLFEQYLLKADFRAAAALPVVEVRNDLGFPVAAHAAVNFGWSRGPWQTTLTGHYRNSYRNSLFTPAEKIESWITGDLYLGYSTDDSAPHLLNNMRLGLSVRNLLDEKPPHVNVPVGFPDLAYDGGNADPIGRFMSLQISKSWQSR